MAEAPVKEFSSTVRDLAEKIVNLSVKDAQSLVDCLKQDHGIEPAGGGAVMMAAPTEAVAAVEKSSFDVILAAAGDKKERGQRCQPQDRSFQHQTATTPTAV